MKKFFKFIGYSFLGLILLLVGVRIWFVGNPEAQIRAELDWSIRPVPDGAYLQSSADLADCQLEISAIQYDAEDRLIEGQKLALHLGEVDLGLTTSASGYFTLQMQAGHSAQCTNTDESSCGVKTTVQLNMPRITEVDDMQEMLATLNDVISTCQAN